MGADEIKSVVAGGGGNTLGYVPWGMQNGFSFAALMPDYSVGGLPKLPGILYRRLLGGNCDNFVKI